MRIRCSSRMSVLVMASALTLSQAVMLRAQEDYPIRVFPLKSIDVETAVQFIQQLGFDGLEAITGDSRTNSLVLRGSEEVLARVRTFIESVDVPSRLEDQPRVTVLIPVQSYPIGELAGLADKVIKQTIAAGLSELAVDEINRQLIVSSSDTRSIEAVRKLVAEVDRPAQTYTVNVQFLSGEIGSGSGASKEGQLPESLKPIADTLRTNGFGTPSLLAPFTLRANANREFFAESILRSPRAAGENKDGLRFYVKGTVAPGAAPEVVDLELDTQITGIRADGGTESLPVSFNLETSLSVPIGRHVVLALAPSTTGDGSAVALIVRVTRE